MLPNKGSRFHSHIASIWLHAIEFDFPEAGQVAGGEGDQQA